MSFLCYVLSYNYLFMLYYNNYNIQNVFVNYNRNVVRCELYELYVNNYNYINVLFQSND